MNMNLTSDMWEVIVAVIIFISAGILDIWLVVTRRKSISITIWLAEKAHPTIIVGVLLLGLYLANIMKNEWWIQATILLIDGHLVTSEGASIALSSSKRWLGKRLYRMIMKEPTDVK